MLGIFIAFIAIFLLVVGDTGKKLFLGDLPVPVIIWYYLLAAIIVDCIYLFFTAVPDISWLPLVYVLPVGILSMRVSEVVFLRALQEGDFSLVQPFKSTGPVIALVITFLALGELPSPVAFVGMLVVLVGAYLMYAPAISKGGLLAPWKALFSEPGPLFMILNQVCAVSASIAQKVGGNASSPVLSFTMIMTGTWVLFSLHLLRRRINPFSALKERHALFYSLALIWGIGLTMIYVSVHYTLVAYVFAVSQLQPLISFPIAARLFHEKIQQRIWPCMVMVLGVMLIIFFQ